MPKVNFMLDDEVREDLVKMVPSRKRSKVVNQAIRKELLRMKREQATVHLLRLRKKTGTLSAQEILDAVQKDRAVGTRLKTTFSASEEQTLRGQVTAVTV